MFNYAYKEEEVLPKKDLDSRSMNFLIDNIIGRSGVCHF